MRILACLLSFIALISSTGRAQQTEPAPCTSSTALVTATWQRIDGGEFTLLLPPGYAGGPVQGVDSSIHEWTADGGRVVRADYGFYASRFERGGPHSPMREPITICDEGSGTERPQVVLYRTSEGMYAAGRFWPQPGGRSIPGRVRSTPVALWMSAESPDPQHQAELLAIIQSVRFK